MLPAAITSFLAKRKKSFGLIKMAGGGSQTNMKNMKIKLEEQDDMTTDSGKEYLHLIIQEQRN